MRLRGVMDGYELSGLGAAGGIPAPPGTELPRDFPVDIFEHIGTALSLRSIGVYTPWATAVSDVEWEAVRQPPDTNVAVSLLPDLAVVAVPQVTFGNTLPFVAILTSSPVGRTSLGTALGGTDYKFYETQACYRQDDGNAAPRIQFLHWCERRGPGDGQAGKSLEAAARSVGGQLVFATQVDYDSTAVRRPPAQAFRDVLALQLGTGIARQEAAPPPVPVAPPPANYRRWVAPGLFAGAVATVTYYVAKKLKERRAS